MIKIKELTEGDIGKYVMYTPVFGDYEIGRIKSWNDIFIFVVYKCGNHWEKYMCYSGIATSPENLIFITK
jgi:hypothetical protein